MGGKDWTELVNEECYDDGWMIRLEISNKDESKELLSEHQGLNFL